MKYTFSILRDVGEKGAMAETENGRMKRWECLGDKQSYWCEHAVICLFKWWWVSCVCIRLCVYMYMYMYMYVFFFFEVAFFFFLIYWFLAVLGLRFVRGLSLVGASGGHSSSRCGDRSSSRCAGLSVLRPLQLRGTGSRRAGSVVVAHGPSCSVACGIFPDQGSNPCPLH